jgi:hypothetical protein
MLNLSAPYAKSFIKFAKRSSWTTSCSLSVIGRMSNRLAKPDRGGTSPEKIGGGKTSTDFGGISAALALPSVM